MAENVSVALESLERAIKLEHEEREYYLRAVKVTQDEAGQEVFLNLADEEGKHLDLIRRQHEALSRDSRWIDSDEVKLVPMDLSRPLLNKGQAAAEKVFSSATSELDALLSGLEIESKSFELYREAAAATIDPQGKSMFAFLAREEASHFDILMMRYDLRFGPIDWSD